MADSPGKPETLKKGNNSASNQPQICGEFHDTKCLSFRHGFVIIYQRLLTVVQA
jgi:hypothetical protein